MASIVFLFLNFNKSLFFIISTTIVVLFLIFNWIILPRADLNYQNFSIQSRLSDYQLAWQKIKEKPWFGYGLTLAMGERPIHSLYLTIAVEVGLVGLFAFLSFATYLLIGSLANKEVQILKIMFSALLALGFFDHFLWTLRPGLAMFWLVAGFLFTNRVLRK